MTPEATTIDGGIRVQDRAMLGIESLSNGAFGGTRGV